MIETRLLHYFLMVAKERSITGAAKALHITQPTLSRQMALLEEQAGVRLFRRGSRPLELTGEGLLLRRRAEEILALLEKAEGELSGQEAQLEGTVSMGCGELASTRLLSEWIAGFSRQHPHVVFEVYTAAADQVKRRMDDGRTDIGLLLEPAEMERYEYIRMPVTERWAALLPAGSPLAGREAVTADDLSGIPAILPGRQKVRDEVASWFGSHYGKLQVSAISNLSTNAALLVRAGLGCALLIEGALPFLEPSEVRLVPLSPALTATSVLAWQRGMPLPPAAVRFLAYVRASLAASHLPDGSQPSEKALPEDTSATAGQRKFMA